MKFIDLSSAQRSMLTALNSTNYLGTDVLGLACVPKLDAKQAANVLLDMRAAGVIYSTQKPDNQRYAMWSCTDYGRAVFMGRPDGDVQPATVTGQAEPAAQEGKRYVLSEEGGVGSFMHGVRDDVLAEAQRRATAKPGKQFNVYEQIAAAHMPVPQAQITLL